MQRVHNFSAGPAALPLEVLKKAQEELTNYHGKGASIMEMSHRGADYSEIDKQATDRLKKLLKLDDNYHVLFLQGGASTQFMMVPYNYLKQGGSADYINTGAWSTKAIKEAKLFGKVNVAFSSETEQFTRVPGQEELQLDSNANYVHYTSNNTIYGTQFSREPETGNVPLVCDASSDFLSRPIDIDRYGIIYAGAQKNLGPSGVTVVIIRNDFLDKAGTEGIPTILKYQTHAQKIFNTPPTFAVYMVNLVLDWLDRKGGTEAIEQINNEKAALLYEQIERDDFYRGTAEKASRSRMNITFRLESEELEKRFLSEASENGMIGLKGHRSVGGIRASIYNACTLDSVKVLVDFMENFRKANG